ncbi:heavy metal translocating P-type ATPase [uncultured Limosilactobacillus sp.]|uniref:heavy metal translocating P-type ATPase n=1 Tax=uncultured Limosilactobacillus sp. TaxID=2837629 RepID=UPI0025FF03C0|nr:heavy metal translocating P-type ATPase [uncultured Limosilactobacillus sp.]
MKSNRQKLMVLCGIALLAAICQWGFRAPIWAQVINSIAGGWMALLMFIDMIKKLRSGDYGVDLLAITAIVATLAVGEYWAAMVILLMLIGGDALEDYANQKAHSELSTLLDKTPRTANQLIDGIPVAVDVNELKVGDQVIIKPGEQVPVDGIVIEGISDVNEATLTGESLPITKHPGEEILSGSVNGDGRITMKVQRCAADSQYQQLVALIQQADQQPARFVRLADRYALPFTIVSYVIAGLAWWIAKDPVRFAQVLVVASPCPLILAAPVAFVSGMSRSSTNGIVVKTGDVIEKLATIRAAAFDKTGTLTHGNLSVSEVVPSGNVSADQLLQFTASAEQDSNHVLAQSVVQTAHQQGLPLLQPTSMHETTAQGVAAVIQGRSIKVGRRTFVDSGQQIQPANVTAIYVTVDHQYWGHVEFQDQLRSETPEVIAQLRARGVKTIMMLTGDQGRIAGQIAKKSGITKVFAGLLPEQKVANLQKLPPEDRPIMMVGDGVNDAPVLKVADVGVAMGARGSTAASESADVVILADDLRKVANAVIIAQDTLQIAKHAVWIGIAVCVVLMLICSTGVVPTIIGALLQEVVDTVCILWGLRARKDLQNLI